MFEPFDIITDSDFNLYKPGVEEAQAADIPKEYVNLFPVLKRYLYVKSSNSHYEVFRSLVFQILCNPNKKITPDNEKMAYEVLEFFINLMPKYPSTLPDKLSVDIVKKINQIIPSSLVKIFLSNPNLIPNDTSIKYIDSLRQFTSLKKGESDQNIMQLLTQIINDVTEETYSSYIPVISTIFSLPYLLHHETPILISLIQKCLAFGIKDILLIDFPSVIMPISRLTPISLLTSRFPPTNDELFATLRLNGFTFRVLNELCTNVTDPQEQITKSLIIHKLLISGYAAIESFIISLHVLGNSFWDFLFSATPKCQSILATAVLCAITTVEIPILKLFYQKYHEQIDELCDLCISTFTDDACRNSWINLRKVMQFSTITPFSVLISSWSGKKHISVLPVLSVLSERDEFFVPLTMCAAKELREMGDPCLVADICRRLMLTGPTPAAKLAIDALALTINPNEILNLLSDVIPPTLFVPAMELVTASNYELNLSDSQTIDSYLLAVEKCVISESGFSLSHLEYLAQYIDDVLKAPHKVLGAFLAKMLQFSAQIRPFIRFLLMLTSTPTFISIIKLFPTESSELYQKIRQVLPTLKDESIIASIAISWRNMIINVKDSSTFMLPVVQNYFTTGIQALATAANKNVVPNVIIAAFCDVATNPVIAPKLATFLRTRLKNKAPFVESLSKINPNVARKEFPDYTQGNVEAPKFYSSIWKSQNWMKYISSLVEY